MTGQTHKKNLLIYAGGSVFGRLMAADLLERTGARLLLVGPKGDAEAQAARDLDPTGERVRAAHADLEDEAGLRAALDGMDAAVCCVRGFQGMPVSLLEACMERGLAYFDIADSRAYMHRVLARRPAIESSGITAGSGLGILPGLSALMTAYAVAELELEEIARVDVAVYIGSHRARGVGALAAALRCAGRPLARNIHGWSGRTRADFPQPIGRRKVYNFDAPDYDLFPGLFGLRQDRIRVRLGFELDIVNRVLGVLGLMRRVGLRPRYKGLLTTALLGMSAPLRAVGEDSGGVQVTARGISGRPGRHAAIRAGSLSVVARDARLLSVLPCATAVACYLDGDLPTGLLDWRGWIAPEKMWDRLRANGLAVEWKRE
ncbi:MAG: saccharopine dehydrogenase family protein [Chloroflexia bacterium]